jgi:hypothetical protein
LEHTQHLLAVGVAVCQRCMQGQMVVLVVEGLRTTIHLGLVLRDKEIMVVQAVNLLLTLAAAAEVQVRLVEMAFPVEVRQRVALVAQEHYLRQQVLTMVVVVVVMAQRVALLVLAVAVLVEIQLVRLERQVRAAAAAGVASQAVQADQV